jgi:hypothetical protein
MPQGLFTIALGPRTTILSDNMFILTRSCYDFVFTGKEILQFAEVANKARSALWGGGITLVGRRISC